MYKKFGGDLNDQGYESPYPQGAETCRRHLYVRVMGNDGDFDFLCGKYDNSKTLQKLHDVHLNGAGIFLQKYTRKKTGWAPAGACGNHENLATLEQKSVTSESHDTCRERRIVHKRVHSTICVVHFWESARDTPQSCLMY